MFTYCTYSAYIGPFIPMFLTEGFQILLNVFSAANPAATDVIIQPFLFEFRHPLTSSSSSFCKSLI